MKNTFALVFLLMPLLSYVQTVGEDKLINSGQGKKVYKNGSFYIGNFVNGLRDGKGAMTYEDYTGYNGTWKKDKRDGAGTYYFNDSTTFMGLFADDVGKGSKRYSDGINIKGTLSANNVFSEDLIALGNLKAILKNTTGTISRWTFLEGSDTVIIEETCSYVAIDPGMIFIFNNFDFGGQHIYPELVWLDIYSNQSAVTRILFRRAYLGYNTILYKVVITNSLDKHAAIFKISQANLAPHQPEIYKKVFVISGKNFGVCEGELLEVGRARFSSSFELENGDPIFNRNGELIGQISPNIFGYHSDYSAYIPYERSTILPIITTLRNQN